MNIEEELKKIVANSLDIDIAFNDIEIEKPKIASYGDYSCNIAMKLYKTLGKNPKELAEDIKSKISSPLIDNIVIANPGFINFFINKSYMFDVIKRIITLNEDYGRNNLGNNKKINLEFVSVNPTGSIHLGHTRGACYGDSLCNVLKFCNYDVTKEYYINDAGNQMNNMALSIIERYKELKKMPFCLGDNYYYGKEIIDVAQKMVDENNPSYDKFDVETFKKYGLNEFLSAIKSDLEDIGVFFDVWTSEQKLRDDGQVLEALNKLKSLGYTYMKDNALYLKTSEFGDEKDRVIVKSDGSYTYFTPDIAYHLNKLNRGFDYLIDVLGADHHGYVNRLKASVTMLGGESDKLSVSLVQMVRCIKDGVEYKISKRTGKTVTLNDLINESGKDAIRYFFVSRSIDTQMDYDLDLANENSNNNPVYYVQYAHARICSILREHDFSLKNDYVFETINSKSAYNVLSKLEDFPKVIEKSAIKHAPHLITNYVYELSSLFHSYYGSEKIITDDEKYTYERIMLIKAVKIVIANALKLIGVTAKERM